MRLSRLSLAWLASSLVFSLMFVAWMFITAKSESAAPPLKGYFQTGLFAFGAGLAIQFIYGGLMYFTLSCAGLFNWWAVLIAYVAPVLLWLALSITAISPKRSTYRGYLFPQLKRWRHHEHLA